MSKRMLAGASLSAVVVSFLVLRSRPEAPAAPPRAAEELSDVAHSARPLVPQATPPAASATPVRQTSARLPAQDGPTELIVELGKDGKGGPQPALDTLVESQPVDAEWTDEITRAVSDLVAKTAGLALTDVRCVEGLCRVRLVRAADAQAEWPDIDDEVDRFVVGEKVFSTRIEGQGSGGYVYFSAPDKHLPRVLGSPEEENELDTEHEAAL